MKKLSLMLLILGLVCFTTIYGAKPNQPELISNTAAETVVKFHVDSYELNDVITPRGIAKRLDVPKAGKMLVKGAPELSRLTTAVAIPDQAKMQVTVIDSQYIDIENINIAPSKGVLTRNINPRDIPYTYGKEYAANAFYPGNLVELGDPYIIRDVRGQNIIAHPFQYNPATKTLRVYTEITVAMSETGIQGENILARTTARSYNPSFEKVYARHFINFEDVSYLQYLPLNDPLGNYLIVSYGDFMDEMAPFVTWKTNVGYNVTMVNYATIGSYTALKTYIANFYNTYGLTYVLLVGDYEQINGYKLKNYYADNTFAMIVGADKYQDVFLGRFSASTGAEVTTQVNRTIYYEQSVLYNETFFTHAIGMGSSEGTGDDGEYDYEHINNILADLAGDGYTTHPCHQAGGSPALMSSLINAGAGVIFYCGHGYDFGWWTADWEYNVGHVDALVNENDLPFIISVACVVGNFKGQTCFSEAWQRATNNGIAAGAIANIGSTINQSWYSPMCAEDEMADILVAGTKRTFGGMTINGMFQMIDEYGSDGEKMAETWVCFGDPSLQLRTPDTPYGPLQ